MSRPERPRVAVIGAGHWGRNLIRNFASLGALAAVADLDASLASERASEQGVAALSFEGVLSNPSIDAVALATPTDLHRPQARAALLAGKHVYIEKPFTRTAADAGELVELAKAQDLRLMAGHLLRYHSGYRRLCAMVQEGAIGRLRYISSNRLAFGILRPGEGALLDLATHDVSMVLGLAAAEPAAVRASGASILDPAHADHVHVHLAFATGVKAHIYASWLHPLKEHRFVALGDDGALIFEDSHPDPARKLCLFRGRIESSGAFAKAVAGPIEAIAFPTAEPLREECAHFLDCIRTGATPLTDGVEATRVMRVIDAARASIQQS